MKKEKKSFMGIIIFNILLFFTVNQYIQNEGIGLGVSIVICVVTAVIAVFEFNDIRFKDDKTKEILRGLRNELESQNKKLEDYNNRIIRAQDDNTKIIAEKLQVLDTTTIESNELLNSMVSELSETVTLKLDKFVDESVKTRVTTEKIIESFKILGRVIEDSEKNLKKANYDNISSILLRLEHILENDVKQSQDIQQKLDNVNKDIQASLNQEMAMQEKQVEKIENALLEIQNREDDIKQQVEDSFKEINDIYARLILAMNDFKDSIELQSKQTSEAVVELKKIPDEFNSTLSEVSDRNYSVSNSLLNSIERLDDYNQEIKDNIVLIKEINEVSIKELKMSIQNIMNEYDVLMTSMKENQEKLNELNNDELKFLKGIIGQ